MASKQLFNNLVMILAFALVMVMAAPSVIKEQASNTTAVEDSVDKVNNKCAWIEADNSVWSESHIRTAYYKFNIGGNRYEWNQKVAPFSEFSQSCHNSGVVCARADVQVRWLDVWYAHRHRRYTVSGDYDYNCVTIEKRSDNSTEVSTEVQVTADSQGSNEAEADPKERAITSCWSWHDYKLADCF